MLESKSNLEWEIPASGILDVVFESRQVHHSNAPLLSSEPESSRYRRTGLLLDADESSVEEEDSEVLNNNIPPSDVAMKNLIRNIQHHASSDFERAERLRSAFDQSEISISSIQASDILLSCGSSSGRLGFSFVNI